MKVIIILLLFQQAFAQQIPAEICANRVDGFRYLAGNDCTGYIECVNSGAFARRCEPGFLMDHRIFDCMPSQQVDCQGRAIPTVLDGTMVPIYPVPRPEVIPKPPTNLRPGEVGKPPVIVEAVPIPEMPRAPVMSSTNAPVVIVTEAPVSVTKSPPGSIEICGNRQNFFRFIAGDDCTGYIECFNRAAFVRICAPGFLFDHKSLTCLDHRMVDCQGRSIPINHNLPLRPVNPEIIPNRPVFPVNPPTFEQFPTEQPDFWRPPQSVPRPPPMEVEQPQFPQFPGFPSWPPQNGPQVPIRPPMEIEQPQFPQFPGFPSWPPQNGPQVPIRPPMEIEQPQFPQFPGFPSWPPHNGPQQIPLRPPMEQAPQFPSFPVWSGQNPSQPINDGNACANMMNGVILPNPNDCGAYFECRSRMVVHQKCEEGKLFDLNLLFCIPDFAVECGSRKVNSMNPPRTPIVNQRPQIPVVVPNTPQRPVSAPQRPNSPQATAQDAICQGKPNGLLIVDPQNCRRYVECQQTVRINHQCRAGESFDARVFLCLPSFAVNCGTRMEANYPIKPVPQIPVHPVHLEPIITTVPQCASVGVYFVRNEKDCSSYWMCVHGVRVEHSCAEGIYFNPKSNQCDFPQNTSCNLVETTPPTPNVIPPTRNDLPDCSNSDQILFHPNTKDCASYFICISRTPVSMTCPRGFLWNPAISQCDSPSNVVCAGTQ